MTDCDMVLERVLRAVTAACPEEFPRPVVTAETRLVSDLGFDSLRISVLALRLEGEFSQPVLLNEWLAAAADVSELTVAALAERLSRPDDGGGG